MRFLLNTCYFDAFVKILNRHRLQIPYDYEVHFGENATPYVTRYATPPVIYETGRDCRPGAHSARSFPVLSLLCTPPCVLYSCLPRLAAVRRKTTYQHNVGLLAAYLMDLWEWDPKEEGVAALFLRRPLILPEGNSASNLALSVPGNFFPTSDTNQPSTQASLGAVEVGPVLDEPNPPDTRLALDKFKPSAVSARFGEDSQSKDVSQESGMCTETAVLDWRASVIPEISSHWSAPADWSGDTSKCMSHGESANDVLFLAGCLDPWELLKYQSDVQVK